jgi:hypothetical protein
MGLAPVGRPALELLDAMYAGGWRLVAVWWFVNCWVVQGGWRWLGGGAKALGGLDALYAGELTAVGGRLCGGSLLMLWSITTTTTSTMPCGGWRLVGCRGCSFT